ncbi:MAG: 2-amino-4-hydroxy-6-hydroxymethyldihydropteridine diphosphokinase [Pseudomarimonas sp.]
MAEPAQASHWLLVLGSNNNAQSVLAQARAALNELGAVVGSSRTVEGADIVGGQQRYLNQLVELHMEADLEAVRVAAKRIERQHGRSPLRMASGICDLDIDVLASLDGDRVKMWLTDKPQRIPAVQQLLNERFAVKPEGFEPLAVGSP